jgi:hypothetical protein
MATTEKCRRCGAACLLTHNSLGKKVLVELGGSRDGRVEVMELLADWRSPEGLLPKGTKVSVRHGLGKPQNGHDYHDDHCAKLKRNNPGAE